MQGLEYRLSIPKYIFSRVYNSLARGKLPVIFPSLKLNKQLVEPKLNSPNWVKLRSLLSGICGSDQNMLKGNESFSMEPYASFPFVMGHENVSEIVEMGSGVQDLKVGDRVIVNPVMGCRVHERELCSQCANGFDALCEHFEEQGGLGAGISLGYHKATGGGWSEFYQAHQSQVKKIDTAISLEKAVLADPLSSVIQPIAEYANGKKEPKTIFIYGAGTIGLLAIVAIRALELPWKVIVGYRYGFQGKMALELGADEIITTGGDFLAKFATLTESKLLKVSLGKPVVQGGVDAVFDCVGSPGTLDDSLRMCKTKGSVILVATGHDLSSVDATPLWFREINLVGTCMSRTVIDPRDGMKKEVYDIVTKLLPSLKIEKLVTQKYKIEDFKQALQMSMNKKQGQVIKVVFDLTNENR